MNAIRHAARPRRLRQRVWNNPLGSGNPTNDVRYVYDDWNLVAILDHQSSILYSFTWGLDLSGSLQDAGGVGGLLFMTVHQGSEAGIYCYGYDGNGNITALVKASDGTLAAQYTYGPFGELLRATGPMAKANPFRFSTKYTDNETDLIYYGYRYYDPSTGRWPNRDPIGEQGSDDPLEDDRDLNLYGFVNNDPLNAIDRLGLLSFSSGCDEDQKARIKEAFEKVCIKVKSCWHRYCLNYRSISREMKKTCDTKDLKVVCHQKATRLNQCLNPYTGVERCGYTGPGAVFQPWHTIHLCRARLMIPTAAESSDVRFSMK
ncbi:MAG: RHS repeat-associated core domain-containing protein [Verrucomicrobia bacterium]|jgi:RHS repeat-associated protein|nr:RHS repeat-associated core domain-containing protein [Verrucomicrobiota bacterium]